MARARRNGNGRLDDVVVTALNQSMASLTQAMATFLTRAAEADAHLAEIERVGAARMADMERVNAARMAEIDARFARIEALLMEHSRILQDHSRILQALPDVIRDKIGFKVSETRPAQ